MSFLFIIFCLFCFPFQRRLMKEFKLLTDEPVPYVIGTLWLLSLTSLLLLLCSTLIFLFLVLFLHSRFLVDFIVTAAPEEQNILAWHYVITGPPETLFEGCVLHMI